jgi:hypothetical protein
MSSPIQGAHSPEKSHFVKLVESLWSFICTSFSVNTGQLRLFHGYTLCRIVSFSLPSVSSWRSSRSKHSADRSLRLDTRCDNGYIWLGHRAVLYLLESFHVFFPAQLVCLSHAFVARFAEAPKRSSSISPHHMRRWHNSELR